MATLKVKFKRTSDHPFVPTYAHTTDAAMDLVAVDIEKNLDHEYVEYSTGVAVQVPEGYVGLVFPRSSISKTSHSLANAVGVIDPGYTGEIKLRMRYKDDQEDREYTYGDKIGQLMLVEIPKVELEEVTDLGKTQRGDGGFGSTDSK